MNNLIVVSVTDSFQYLTENIQPLAQLHGPRHHVVLDHVAQRMAVHKFHNDKVNVIVLPYVVNFHNIGTVQTRCRLRFAQKTLNHFLS